VGWRARELAGRRQRGVPDWGTAVSRAQEALGARFDSRAFHEMLLADGALPFAALNAKVDRWISARR
jgi:uncharacterized protein (DUF885 family)